MCPVRPFLFVCSFRFTLQNILIAEHLVPSCQCYVGSLKQAKEVGVGDYTSFFSFFMFRFYVISFTLLLLIFTKIILLLLFRLLFFFFCIKTTLIFSFSRMFRNVPCSGFYPRPSWATSVLMGNTFRCRVV